MAREHTMERMSIVVEGMSCEHCVRAVAAALEGVDGVEVEKVEIGSAEGVYDPARTSPDCIAAAIREAGYEVGGMESPR